MTQIRKIKFDEEMNKDVEEIRRHFQKTFKVRPSNTDIMSLLLKTFKETNIDINRKPKSKKSFMVRF